MTEAAVQHDERCPSFDLGATSLVGTDWRGGGATTVGFTAEVRRNEEVRKRIFDVVVATLMLCALLPLLVLTAVAVKMTSRGPVLFRQVRVGRDGSRFVLLKFRSMVVGAERMVDDLRDRNEAPGPLFKVRHDPRVTALGRWLRKLSIDELPQLWNVLRGEMSLVGPRPALPDEAACWAPQVHRRLRVKPGITGMWQVSGRSCTTFDDYVRLDLEYADNPTLRTDLAILVRTIPVVLRRRGAW